MQLCSMFVVWSAVCSCAVCLQCAVQLAAVQYVCSVQCSVQLCSLQCAAVQSAVCRRHCTFSLQPLEVRHLRGGQGDL